MRLPNGHVGRGGDAVNVVGRVDGDLCDAARHNIGAIPMGSDGVRQNIAIGRSASVVLDDCVVCDRHEPICVTGVEVPQEPADVVVRVRSEFGDGHGRVARGPAPDRTFLTDRRGGVGTRHSDPVRQVVDDGRVVDDGVGRDTHGHRVLDRFAHGLLVRGHGLGRTCSRGVERVLVGRLIPGSRTSVGRGCVAFTRHRSGHGGAGDGGGIRERVVGHDRIGEPRVVGSGQRPSGPQRRGGPRDDVRIRVAAGSAVRDVRHDATVEFGGQRVGHDEVVCHRDEPDAVVVRDLDGVLHRLVADDDPVVVVVGLGDGQVRFDDAGLHAVALLVLVFSAVFPPLNRDVVALHSAAIVLVVQDRRREREDEDVVPAVRVVLVNGGIGHADPAPGGVEGPSCRQRSAVERGGGGARYVAERGLGVVVDQPPVVDAGPFGDGDRHGVVDPLADRRLSDLSVSRLADLGRPRLGDTEGCSVEGPLGTERIGVRQHFLGRVDVVRRDVGEAVTGAGVHRGLVLPDTCPVRKRLSCTDTGGDRHGVGEVDGSTGSDRRNRPLDPVGVGTAVARASVRDAGCRDRVTLEAGREQIPHSDVEGVDVPRVGNRDREADAVSALNGGVGRTLRNSDCRFSPYGPGVVTELVRVAAGVLPGELHEIAGDVPGVVRSGI